MLGTSDLTHASVDAGNIFCSATAEWSERTKIHVFPWPDCFTLDYLHKNRWDIVLPNNKKANKIITGA